MSTDSDRREFPRLRRSVVVRFKYLSSEVQHPAMQQVCEGTTTNISIGGLLLLGPIPSLDLIKDLLLGRINVGINVSLPGTEDPVKALTKVSWLEAREEGEMAFRIGLRIVDMPAEHRKILNDYLAQVAAIP